MPTSTLWGIIGSLILLTIVITLKNATLTTRLKNEEEEVSRLKIKLAGIKEEHDKIVSGLNKKLEKKELDFIVEADKFDLNGLK